MEYLRDVRQIRHELKIATEGIPLNFWNLLEGPPIGFETNNLVKNFVLSLFKR